MTEISVIEVLIPGPQGPVGPKGDQGVPGSVPNGGTVDQVLAKASSENGDVYWRTVESGGGGGEGTVKSVNGIQPDSEGNVTLVYSYTELDDVPESFPPSLHDHDASQFTSGTLDLNRIPGQSFGKSLLNMSSASAAKDLLETGLKIEGVLDAEAPFPYPGIWFTREVL